MDFQLNEEQLHLKKSVREFAEREIKPNVMKWDEAGEFPLATIKELGKLGMLGMIFPAEYGGAGMGYVEYVTAIEELSRVDGSVGIIVAAHTSLCSNHIFLAGSETQKAYLASPPQGVILKEPYLIPGDGGLPIKIGNEVVGALGVSGSPGKDEVCGNAALDLVRARLK